MLRDISDSSEDEEAPQTEKAPQTAQTKRLTKYECPEEFTAASYLPCLGTQHRSVFGDNKELWLIKAPANFDPRRLAGMKLPLMGFKSVQTGDSAPGGGQQILSVLGRRSTPASGFRLLTTDPTRPDAHLCAPAFSGMLNVSDSYGDCGSNQGPIPVPAAPAPCLPDGLRQRYLPFGSGRPGAAPEEAAAAPTPVTTPAYTPVPTAMLPPAVQVKQEPETPRKRKKEKRNKAQEEEAPAPAPAPVAVPLAVNVKVERPDQDTHSAEERKEKKKKKKKDKEKEREKDAETETVVVKTEVVQESPVVVKQEPADVDYSEPAPKKKKKKKFKTDD